MHVFNPTILREYDIRGTVGETLGPDDARALGRAYGTLIGGDGGKRVAVGYDGRHSSPELEAALVEGITSAGLDVVRIGLGPTPMLYYTVFELDLDGGVQITGSHNPPEFNGFKMMRGKASLHGEDIQTLGRIAAAGDWETGDGKAESEEMLDRYVARLTRDFGDLTLTAAWDAGNGAAGEAVKRVTQALSEKQTVLYCEIDGDFPNHHPDPTVEENLADLKQAVVDGGLDAGLGFDGDGDRIGAVDGSGHVIWGDQILLLLARDVLKDVPGATIIADVKSSQTLFDDIARLGGKPVMWNTGHSLIKTRMAELGAPLAGEMSGHIFFKHRFYGFDDAIYAGLRLLAAVQASGKSLEELRKALPPVVNTPELRFDCPEERKFAAVDEVKERLLAEGKEAVTIDGVRVKAHDGWWLLRASNTQPVLVARAEAPDEERLNLIKEELVEILASVGLTPPPGM